MRIPLDYYRILGLPIQSTAEQLQQSHRDRTLQLPRREYSEAAIAARKQLIDEAYAVLSEPVQRQLYDSKFLAKSYELETGRGDLPLKDASGQAAWEGPTEIPSDPYTPSIEIQDAQLIGALLILLELGEYELVLKLGRPYLSSGSISLNNGRFGDPDIVLSDIVLTVALACLELGREQWQQGQYENAAESLETGQELLLREGCFPGIRGEMQSDLYKLRPYRILELLALPEASLAERQQGLMLLQDMLNDRGGIDGSGDDQSGLNIDDFLRFVQQLRSYLTAAEQQVLFEGEARRPSAVATYLAVYALLGRGFAERQPALIRRAKLMLIRLGTRQDVHLEQAVCALLLGQTEEASRALELSQEYESLAFIREHSQGSPDLLPGLCLYGERWLQNEVFPHFRDLSTQQTSLKEYFADEQVQAYLEELPNEPEPVNHWTPTNHTAVATAPVTVRYETTHAASRSRMEPLNVPGNSAGRGATATLDPSGGSTNGTATLPTAERVSRLPQTSRPTTGIPVAPAPEGREPGGSGGESRGKGQALKLPKPTPLPSRRSRQPARLDRMLFLLAVGVLGVGAALFLGSRAFSWLAQSFSAGPTLEGEQLQIQLDRPPIEIPDPTVQVTPTPDPTQPLTEQSAQTIVQSWLTAKSAAMGETRDLEQLSQVLTGAALTQWQRRAEEAQRDNWHWVLQHPEVEVMSVETSETNPDQAQVEAVVKESAEFYQDGQLDLNESYDTDVRVRYSLVRQDGQWRIQGMDVVN